MMKIVLLAVLAGAVVQASAGEKAAWPDPVRNPGSSIMLVGAWVPEDPGRIDFEKLPLVPSQHAVISDVRDRGGDWVHQHAYLAHHGGRYWAMWSDGPGLRNPKLTSEQHRNVVPGHDRPDTRVSFATSEDGLHWSRPADLAGPPRVRGFGWIARGLWIRDGELLALASHFNAPGYSGEGLSLEAFRWDGSKWIAIGTALDDSMNNFPPKRLPSGEWMMTRRDHDRQVSVMIGGVAAFDQWEIRPLASYDGKGRPEEPYWYILPDGKNIVGLIRDNGGSKRLLRTFSTDSGRSWSPIVRTDFPDAQSKFFALRTSRGYHVLVSNANPARRDPLTLAISADGLVYTKLFRLIGGRHIDYPHMIEQDGNLFIAFSGAKQTMEVLKVSLDDLEKLTMPAEVELVGPSPRGVATATSGDWIDLGDEGKMLFVSAELKVPARGRRAAISLATRAGQSRVTVGVDPRGRLSARLYEHEVDGDVLEAGQAYSVWMELRSHRDRPDQLWLKLGGPGAGGPVGDWNLVNDKGSSNANLSRVLLSGDEPAAGFTRVRVGTTRGQLRDVEAGGGR